MTSSNGALRFSESRSACAVSLFVTMTSGYASARRFSASVTPGYGPHVGTWSYTARASSSRYSRPSLREARSMESATIRWNGLYSPVHSSIRYALQACRKSSAISAGSRSPRTSRIASLIRNLISVPFMSNVTNFGLRSNPIIPPSCPSGLSIVDHNCRLVDCQQVQTPRSTDEVLVLLARHRTQGLPRASEDQRGRTHRGGRHRRWPDRRRGGPASGPQGSEGGSLRAEHRRLRRLGS